MAAILSLSVKVVAFDSASQSPKKLFQAAHDAVDHVECPPDRHRPVVQSGGQLTLRPSPALQALKAHIAQGLADPRTRGVEQHITDVLVRQQKSYVIVDTAWHFDEALCAGVLVDQQHQLRIGYTAGPSHHNERA